MLPNDQCIAVLGEIKALHDMLEHIRFAIYHAVGSAAQVSQLELLTINGLKDVASMQVLVYNILLVQLSKACCCLLAQYHNLPSAEPSQTRAMGD